jgi:hypothetical protein
MFPGRSPRKLAGMTQSSARVVVFAEKDYCYGRGPLTLRIGRIDYAHPVRYDGDVFYRVQGVQLSWTGAEILDREVLVRARRLPGPGPNERVAVIGRHSPDRGSAHPTTDTGRNAAFPKVRADRG